MENDRIWTKAYVLLMVANFFVAMNFYAPLSTTASYTLNVMHVSETAAGFAAGIFVIGSLFARIFLIRYTPKFGFKRSLYVSLGALIVISLLFFVVKGYVAFCAIRFLAGITFGINNNTLFTIVTYIIPDKKKGEGVAWFSMSQGLGMAIGPFFAVYIMHQSGFQNIFLLSLGVAIAALIVVIFIKEPTDAEKGAATSANDAAEAPALPPPEERGLWSIFERSAINIAVLSMLFTLCYMNYLSFAAIFVTESGATNLSSVIFLLTAGTMVVSRPFVGKSFDKHGPDRIITVGFIFFAAGLFLLGRGILPLILPSAAFIGLGLGMLQGGTLPIIVINSPRHRLAIANATYFFAIDLGAAIGPVIGGKIVEYAGYGRMYTIVAIVAIICIPLYYFVLGKKPKPELE